MPQRDKIEMFVPFNKILLVKSAVYPSRFKYENPNPEHILLVNPFFFLSLISIGDFVFLTKGTGPFDTPASSMMTISGNELANVHVDPPIFLPQFTISFYWRTDGSTKGGIVSFDGQSSGCFWFFSLISDKRDLLISHFESTVCEKPKRTIRLLNIFTPNEFTFVSIVYRRYDQVLLIYNELGNILAVKEFVEINQQVTRQVLLGYGVNFDGTGLHLVPHAHAIACFSVHSSILNRQQITALPCVCQMQNKN